MAGLDGAQILLHDFLILFTEKIGQHLLHDFRGKGEQAEHGTDGHAVAHDLAAAAFLGQPAKGRGHETASAELFTRLFRAQSGHPDG